ncbi:protein-export chaperone SecB [candidate division WOR-3 bacterium]|nr:protein-export chaperone SecB [candidate division WOR-3 bacterium]
MGKEKVSQDIYEKFIKGLSLRKIKIVYSEAKVDESFSPPAKVEIEEKKGYKLSEEGEFIVTHAYKLKGIKKDKKKVGFQISVTYKLTYKSKTHITDEIFDLFSKTSLPLQTWPYFRQFVHEMSGRMGLPALTLDLLKFE